MKTKSAIKRLCKHCKIVKRRGRNFVICKKNPRHKQRQGFHTTTGAASAAANTLNSSSSLMFPTFEFSNSNKNMDAITSSCKDSIINNNEQQNFTIYNMIGVVPITIRSN